jgi:TRAP-type C4-dicarboxylate transport system permease small subunit
MRRFERAVLVLSKWLNYFAGAALVLMLTLVIADVVGAKVFHTPLPGGIELTAFLGVIVIGFAIAQTQVMRRHIEVEFLVLRLPRTAQRAIASTIYPLAILLFALIAWKSFEFGRTVQSSGEVSMTQGLPFYPLLYGTAFSAVVVCLVLIVQYISDLRTKK